MNLSKLNASSATMTKNRTRDSVSTVSGMCATCVEGCIGMCEIGKSAYRGQETIYPQPFGLMTTASEKNYPVDYSHFTILGTANGAAGIEANSDLATFSNVSLENQVGKNGGIKSKLPLIIPGIGSTDVARNNWEGLAIGSALAGTMLTIGENVCGMDPETAIMNGKVVRSSDMARRVKLYQDWQFDGYGTIVVQANVEDLRTHVLEYVIEKLGIEAVELKWGQGAKDIGGEVKINSLDKAVMLKQRGYLVLPDPENPGVVEAYNRGVFKEFERHSRVGMIDQDTFLGQVQQLRNAGARYIFLKTGAYRPVDLAKAVKYASLAGIDLLTVDGAGGGTGMSPWRMMNEWGIPPVELHSLLYQYCETLNGKNEYIPDIALAGGFTLEDQLFKGLAMVAPYTKLIGMARAPLAAVMVGKTIGRQAEENKLPSQISQYGNSPEDIFIAASKLKEKLGADTFKKVPAGALGLYTYYERLAQGLKQLMCGSRKFALEYLSRNDIASLTPEASMISKISYVMDVDKEKAEQIINS
ncbi:MAG: glutamate synthase-related protein [Bacillota bacterium]